MAKAHNQKAKILFLAQMLYETGENRTISMQEILANLMEHGIRAERKSIYDDFEALREFGLDVRFKRTQPSGYYLAGKTEEMGFLETEKKEIVDFPEEKKTEAVVNGDEAATVWNMPENTENVENAEKKPMKLLCKKTAEEEIKAYFREKAEYKEKNPEYFMLIAPQLSNAEFFGWLTWMGKDVHIAKPRKLAIAYRDYLKTLTKDYKGI